VLARIALKIASLCFGKNLAHPIPVSGNAVAGIGVIDKPVTLNLPHDPLATRITQRQLSADEHQCLALDHKLSTLDRDDAAPTDPTVVQDMQRDIQLADATVHIQCVKAVVWMRAGRHFAQH
jgi:hypothetical protein